MNKFCIVILLVVISTTSRARIPNTPSKTIFPMQLGNVLAVKDFGNDTTDVTYRLFPTQNMWTFIKLNTRNGLMWQVQYDVSQNNRFQLTLNSVPQIDKGKEVDNRFTLYPTQNIYTFILVDQIDGRIWQVQWSTKAENRFIIPIE